MTNFCGEFFLLKKLHVEASSGQKFFQIFVPRKWRFFYSSSFRKTYFYKKRDFFFKIYNGDRAYFFHLGQQDAETHSLQKFYILEISFLKYNCISRGKNKILELWSRLNEIYIKLKLIEIWFIYRKMIPL